MVFVLGWATHSLAYLGTGWVVVLDPVRTERDLACPQMANRLKLSDCFTSLGTGILWSHLLSFVVVDVVFGFRFF